MPSFNSIKFLLIFLFSLSITACGGGGGGGGSDPTKPTVDDFTKSISKSATTVGTLVANDGGKAITVYAITGADAASFDVSGAGVISVKSSVTLDPINKSSFAFKATATNEIGTSEKADVTITISSSKPTISDFTTSIPENSATVGQLPVDNGGKAITAFTLSGADSASFKVSDQGVVSVKSGVTLDSTVKSSYVFTVTATNDLGTSDKATVTVTVTLVEQNFSGQIPKLMPIGDSITAGKPADSADKVTIVVANLVAAKSATSSITEARNRLNDDEITLALAAVTNAINQLGLGGDIGLSSYGTTTEKASDAITLAKSSIEAAAAAAVAVTTKEAAEAAKVAALATTNMTQAIFDAATATPINTAAVTAFTNAGGTQKQLDAIALNTQANITLAGTAASTLTTAKNNAAAAIPLTEIVQTIAQNTDNYQIKVPSYRKNLTELAAATGSLVKFDAVGISFRGDFEDNQHEGYSGWLAEQLTDKNAVYAGSDGTIFTGGAVNVETVDGKKVLSLVASVPAENICTDDKITSGDCTAQQEGQIITDVFADKLSVIDYSLSANDGNNNPDIALIHIGTNDMAFRRSSGDENISNTEYSTNKAIAGVEELIDTLRAKNDRIVILLAQIIPISEASIYYAADVIEGYNARLATLAGTMQMTQSPIVVVDHFGPFKEGDLSALLIDGVHPTAAGDQLMAETWNAALLPFFK